MLSVTCFYPRGVLKAVPDRFDPDEKEMEELIARQEKLLLQQHENENENDDDNDSKFYENNNEESDNETKPKESKQEDVMESDVTVSAPSKPIKGKKNRLRFEREQEEKQRIAEEDKFLKELNMDDYDNDGKKNSKQNKFHKNGEKEEQIEPEDESTSSLTLGGKQLMVYRDNSEDPYITRGDDEDDDDSDDEDLIISPTDSIILTAKTEDEHSTLEMYIYDEDSCNLFVHHDLPLTAFPLCVQWLTTDPNSQSSAASGPVSASNNGAFVAVGLADPTIEIFNLNELDALEPVATLGGPLHPQINGMADDEQSTELKPGSHASEVMSLSWHPTHPQRLISGGADKTIKCWDVCTQQCVETLSHIHTDKVQTIQLNYSEPNVLLSGAYDRTVAMSDLRAPQSILRAALDSDAECVRWSPHEPLAFLVSSESGMVTLHDARKMHSNASQSQSRIFQLNAHRKACTAVSWSSKIPTLMATASLDGHVRLWDLSPSLSQPSQVCERELRVGGLFSMAFDVNESSHYLLTAGGEGGKLAIWDVSENGAWTNKYEKYLSKAKVEVARRPVEIKKKKNLKTKKDDDDEDSDNDDEMEEQREYDSEEPQSDDDAIVNDMDEQSANTESTANTNTAFSTGSNSSSSSVSESVSQTPTANGSGGKKRRHRKKNKAKKNGK